LKAPNHLKFGYYTALTWPLGPRGKVEQKVGPTKNIMFAREYENGCPHVGRHATKMKVVIALNMASNVSQFGTDRLFSDTTE